MHEDHGSSVPTDDYGSVERVRLVNQQTAAHLLGGITEREVRRRVKDGDLEQVKLGRRSLILVSSIDAYVARLRVSSAA